jgi:hypothetical protein
MGVSGHHRFKLIQIPAANILHICGEINLVCRHKLVLGKEISVKAGQGKGKVLALPRQPWLVSSVHA